MGWGDNTDKWWSVSCTIPSTWAGSPEPAFKSWELSDTRDLCLIEVQTQTSVCMNKLGVLKNSAPVILKLRRGRLADSLEAYWP